ncbi:MAG: nitronate monooxygenase [Chloroflexi bacterium]|nr:nitronate monooxygenase [Chloroflexota bacterium]
MKLPKLRIGHLAPRFPIVQGGMGVRVSTAPLAAAVANCGGIGTLSAAEYHNKNRKAPKTDLVRGVTVPRPYLYAPEMAAEIRRARSMTQGIVGVNVMYALTDFYDLVMTCVDAGADFIVTGAGFSRDIFGFVRDFAVPVISICDQPGLARIAERLGASAIVVEGKEAGGHLGSDRPTREILPGVAGAVGIPVIAAGGIWSGEDMEEMFRLGASGIQMATRFVCTHECEVSAEFKQAYLDCKKEDIAIIKSPVGLPGRAIRNKFLNRTESGEKMKFKCPLLCLKTCKAKDANYCIASALINSYQGNTDEGIIFAGENAYRCDRIVSVQEIFDDLLSRFELDEPEESAVGAGRA